MEHQEMQETATFLPVILRLDRLDRLLQLLEERHSLSRREISSTAIVEKDECKDLSSALEEVHHKGTLMERLSVLENRVLQLSLEMDEGNTSKSSSSTVQVSQGIRNLDSELCNETRQDENVIITTQEIEGPPAVQTAQQKSERRRKKAHKKWLGLFRFPLTC
ncbi:Hypothetical predicted protein [Olea europaea subsp. europaea]|uniref:Uncharacterized protein n=1 Tax=Olea europaea subsp. europaea TaxID=158383 RepID=A0A8S0TCG4_OLEEU|nr:Hypothetical predicted protein [Olea europaea subsp. europaea]